MGIRRLILLLIVAEVGMMLSSLSVLAAPHNRFRRYDVRNGLSNSMVKDILQDSRGYMWFATGDGLSRFNGENFRSFCSSSEEKSLNIDAICLHPDGNKIWIGCNDGLYIFDCISLNCRKMDFGGQIPSNVNCLHYDNAGRLWVGCNNGVFKVDESACTVKSYVDSTPPMPIMQLLLRDLKLWIKAKELALSRRMVC